MRRAAYWTLPLLAAGMAFTGAAWANEPATAGVVQLGLGFRYGVDLQDGEFNPWGNGLGLSGGVTLHNALYLGGNFDYFLGEEIETAAGRFSGNVWQVMGDGGYDVGLGEHVVLRPKVGVGAASVSGEACPTGLECAEDSAMHPALAPGATFLLLTSGFSMSVDLRYDVVLADPESLSALLFSVGLGF